MQGLSTTSHVNTIRIADLGGPLASTQTILDEAALFSRAQSIWLLCISGIAPLLSDVGLRGILPRVEFGPTRDVNTQ